MLKEVKPSEIASSKDPKWIAKLMLGHLMAEQTAHYEASEQIAEGFNEYFRKNFRKLKFAEALNIMGGFLVVPKLSESLNEKFWVWETLEEAVRADLDQRTKQAEKNGY